MQATTEDLIKLYEAKESTLAVIFNAFRCSRKIGFRLCQYKVSKELHQYYAALFCFSLIDNSLCDDLINSDAPKKISSVQSAISGSRLLRSHVEFVLSYSPVIDWNGGQYAYFGESDRSFRFYPITFSSSFSSLQFYLK